MVFVVFYILLLISAKRITNIANIITNSEWALSPLNVIQQRAQVNHIICKGQK